MGLRDILTGIDIFGSPFQFEMGIGKAKRKTSFGGLLSIFLLAVGILYFAYLNYLFANGLLMPKITSQQSLLKKNKSFAFDSSLFWFDQQNIDDSTNLMDYQKQNSLNIVKYTATLITSDANGNVLPAINIPVVFCSTVTQDINVDAKAQCLDFSGVQAGQQEFKFFANKGYDTNIIVEWATTCDPIGDPTCSQANQDDYVFGPDWTFNLYIQEQQFDSTQNAMVGKIEVNNWDFDASLTTISTVTLSTSETTVKDGFIVQTPTVYTYFSQSTSNDSFKTRGASAKVDPLAIFKFTMKLDQTQFIDNIQYAQYPEILAQFGSIVNVLLLVGIIGVIVAKADIQQYFVDQKLKEYYRQTAYRVLTSDGKQLKEKEHNTGSESKVTKDQIIKIMKEIDSKDMNAELTKKIKISMIDKIIKSVKAEQKEDYSKKKRGNYDIYETLYFQSTKCSDIFELQSDLMHMKKILAMLITPEQYAAIKCCGSSITDQIPFLLERNEDDKKKQTENGEKIQVEMESQCLLQEKSLNHIELIDKVDYDESYFHHKLDNFFKKSEKGFEGDDDYNKRMNQRLLACLNKTYGAHNESQ